jgi:hypothetical protein
MPELRASVTARPGLNPCCSNRIPCNHGPTTPPIEPIAVIKPDAAPAPCYAAGRPAHHRAAAICPADIVPRTAGPDPALSGITRS